jgi:hypothetical protein
MIRGLLNRISQRIRSWFEHPRFKKVERVDELTDVPEQLRRDVVVMAGPARRPKWVVFMCPCDRGHHVTLSLQESHWPHWQLRLDGDLPTFHPSIDVPNEYRCHYWIVRGRVRWALSAPRR